MSYTLRGRIESRLAASLAPLLAAAGLALFVQDWWPFVLGLLMLAVGLTFDAAVYDRALRYQPAWAALVLGLLELAALMGAIRGLGLKAPPTVALPLFASAWLLAQVLAHAGFPRLRLEYAEDGGELGLGGAAAAAAVFAVLASAGGVAWATQPPTLRLEAGVHQGPLLLDHSQRVIGEPGAVVRGGIRITSSDVTVRGVNVEGGEYGISVDGGVFGVRNVMLDDVHVRGAELDGINVRHAQVVIRRCSVIGLRSVYAQGIDISFAADLPATVVDSCTVVGGQEGIATNLAMVHLTRNTVLNTTMRAITLGEMSMGMVEHNRVGNALGVGILCGDHSECEIERNVISGTRPDTGSTDPFRRGVAILSHYGSTAELRDNRLVASPGGVSASADAAIVRR